jgi:dTMP kinase
MSRHWAPPQRSARTIRALLGKLEKKRGLLIAFEGPDGSGKTTQRKLFKTWLKGQGVEVVSTKWNSSEFIKPLVRARKAIRSLSPIEYCLLHACDFRHRLETEILPALCAGKTVIADRYLFTALARDAARGLDLDWVLNLYAPLLWPDVVLYFSVTPETAHRRISSERAPSYYESGQDITGLDDPNASYGQFMGRVIQEYEALALVFQFLTIDAEESIYAQHKRIRTTYEQAQRRKWPDFDSGAVRDWLELRPEVLLG